MMMMMIIVDDDVNDDGDAVTFNGQVAKLRAAI